MIGTVIDNEYRVDSVLGEGAFGVVYRCWDLKLERPVAIKVLRGTREPKELERFLAEGRVLASLSHPNVVQIYRLGEQDSAPFIVMEYLTGTSFRALVSGGGLPLRDSLGIMTQVAAGLEAIHAKGIIHRDLSCNNVVVSEEQKAKILDLGLAKDPRDLSTLSPQGTMPGTMGYISPEQIEGERPTFASDIFSFGVLLYEILTRRHPFWAEHPMSLLYNITNRRPEPLDRYVEKIPLRLSQLTLDCLNKNPADRPADMKSVRKDLERISMESSLDSTVFLQSERTTTLIKRASGNPFLNRTMIRRSDDFFGRTHEIRRIYSRLNATPPGSVSLVGDRKIGKSSLLNYVYTRKNREENLEHPEQAVMVFVDLQEEKDMTMESFVTALLHIAGLEVRGRIDVSDCTPNLDGIKKLVQRFHEKGIRLVLLLDEFEAITSNPSFNLEFFSFLRFLANHFNVAYLTSSARDLQSLCHTQEISDSPFFNIFTTMRISVLRREEAEELIRVPSERVGKPLAPYTSKILELTGFFPFFIQIVSSHAIDYLEENPSRNEPDFQEVGRRFYEEAKLHYRYIWKNLGSHEKSALLRVARGSGIPVDLRHVLQELEERHLVELDDGTHHLFSQSFETFVAEEGGGGKKRPLLKRLFNRP